MASGKQHAQTTSAAIIVVVTVVASVVAVALEPEIVTLILRAWRESLVIIAGLVVGHYATPDVRDQHDRINEGERLVKEHFGEVAFCVFWAIWWIPAKIIPHRSWLSHLPVVATTLAALWLYWLPYVVLRWYGVIVPIELMAWHVVGWAIQDTVHLAQDGWRIKF